MYKIVFFLASVALASAKPSVVAAPLAAPLVAAPAPFVTATSSQYVARNFNGLVSAPLIAPAPFVPAARFVAAPAPLAAARLVAPAPAPLLAAAPAAFAAPGIHPAYARYAAAAPYFASPYSAPLLFN